MDILFDKFLPDYAPKISALSVCLNLRPYDGKFMPVLNDIAVSTSGTATTIPLVMFSVRAEDGNVESFIGTNNAIWRMDGTTLTDVKQAAYTATQWDWDVYGNALVLCDRATEIQILNPFLSDAAAADLSATAPKCRSLAMFKDQLFCLYTNESGTDYPRRVRRSVKGDLTKWSGPGAGFKDLESFGQEGIALRPLADKLIAYLNGSIWQIYEAGAPMYFGYQRLITGISLIPGAVHSIAVVDKHTHVVLGDKDVYLVGIEGIKNIGKGIRTSILSTIDVTIGEKITHSIDRKNKLVTFSFVSTGSSDGNVDKELIYNYEEDRFGESDYMPYCRGNMLSPGVTIDGLDAYGTYIDDITQYTIDSAFWKGGTEVEGVIPKGGSNDKILCTQSGTARNQQIEYAGLDFKDKTMVTKARPIIESPQGTVILSLLGRDNDTEEFSLQSSTMKSDGRCDLRLTLRQAKIGLSVTGSHAGIRGIRVNDENLSDVGDR